MEVDIAMEVDGIIESNLVTRLLLKATSGKDSYSSVQEDSYAAYLDGLRHPEVTKLASCGNWGQNPGNVRRDIHTAFFSNIGYPHAENVVTSAINTRSAIDCLGCLLTCFVLA